jgi:hypothetical protein
MKPRSPLRTLLLAGLCSVVSLSLPAQAQPTGLETTAGQSIGVSLISYKYEEPGLMNLKATKLGFDYAATYVFGSQWPSANQALFVRGEIQYANGKADYSSVGTGTKDDNEDWYYELRGLLGRDYNMGSYVLAPYFGLGYRFLRNDLRGQTSTNNNGYLRENTLTTAVVGLAHRTRLNQTQRLETRLEYMHVLKGKQKVGFADIGGTDLSLDQDQGYGVRFSAMWGFGQWSVGPVFTYWKVKDSETGVSFNRSYLEPKNETTEIGLKAAYHF